MVAVFMKLVNMSITASWLIGAVLLLRLLLRKAPKSLHCFLWCLVGIRLVCPFSVESVFSLIPQTEVMTQELLYDPQPQVETGVPVANQVVNAYVENHLTPTVGDSVNPLQIATAVAAVLWCVGMGVLLLYATISYLCVQKRVREAVRLRENIYQSERVDSPFVLGLVRPRIYVPFSLKKEELECVIAHEQAHIKRGDHLVKPLGFLLLCVYWFQPLIWVAYVLLGRDMELACDEKVIRESGINKKLYSETLLKCSVPHAKVAACPLAFGEVGVKHRIKNIVNYKKPAFWVVVVSALLCVVLVVCFMTDPKAEETPSVEESSGVYELIGEALSHETASEDQTILTSPPTLQLQDALSGSLDYFPVNAGTYSWNHKEENGQMVGIEACGVEPTSAVKGQEWLQVKKYNQMSRTPYSMGWEVTPDRITVRIYDLLELGDVNPDVLYGEETYEAPFLLELEPRCIYEICAEWDAEHLDAYGFYGNAYYIFATDNDWKDYHEDTPVESNAGTAGENSDLQVGSAFTEEVNRLDGVSMRMEQYQSTEGEVEFVNTTDTEYIYGEYYDIQVQKDGVWYSLQYAVDGNVAFNAVGYNAAAGTTSVWQVNWEWLYGELPAGQYRIVKDILDVREPGDYTKYYLAAEFEIQ